MLVHFVTDAPNKIPAIRAMLEPQHAVLPHVLGAAAGQAMSSGVLVVDANLRQAVPVEHLKTILRDVDRVSEKLFVVQSHLRDMIAQAFALGATAVVSRPREVAAKLEQVELAEKAMRPETSDSMSEVANGAEYFTSVFSSIETGRRITLLDAEKATDEVINGIRRSGLNAWLDDVRRYHEGTFQHCLLVTGVAVGFALQIKFPDADVKRLGLAATLHDIGKARIPLAILDKPGCLDPGELEIMNRHPVIGYELLQAIPEMSPEILDGVRHHHEYLDGSGYPDKLVGSQISDLVRLLTISDIFAALVESRPYRPSMSRQDAYKILCGMEGKLEGALVRAFRSVALA
ncbi:MAG: HD domain-containing protein [Bradyrhizobium icense]|jgi:putative nucleotidyltransferase with HDIG domain|nr:MAG: HD domain-containing protein [Bradyrhizobium icense]